LAVAVIGVYAPVRHFDFVNYDDSAYVYENSLVSAGFSRAGLVWAFTTSGRANWHPLTWLSHMLDCQVFGLWAAGHHLVNVAFHLVNSVLLVVVLRRMTGRVWEAGLVAGLFALHPLHVESVAWVSERKDVLSTLFFLLTLLAYERYVRKRGVVRYLVVFISLALGLMAKPMLVTVPFLLLLLDWWPLARLFSPKHAAGVSPGSVRSTGETPVAHVPQSSRSSIDELENTTPRKQNRALRLLLEKIPLALLVAGSSVITWIAQYRRGAMSMLGEPVSFPARLANSLTAYVTYLEQMVWPAGLAAFYPFRLDRPWWQPVGAGVLLVAVTATVLALARRRPYLVTGWFWYLGTMVPVIGLVQVGAHATADRYTYMPLIGIFIMAAWGLSELVSSWPVLRGPAITTSLAVVVILAIVASLQVRHWANSESLFRRALAVTSENWVAHDNLADALLKQRRYVEAAEHSREALRLAPCPTAGMHNELAIAIQNQGRVSEAIEHYRAALELKPDFAAAHNNLAMILAPRGEVAEAVDHLCEAVRLCPERADAYINLARIRATCPDRRFRDGPEAVRLAQEACRLSDDNNTPALSVMVDAYAEAGRFADAAAAAREAAGRARKQGDEAAATAMEQRARGYAGR